MKMHKKIFLLCLYYNLTKELPEELFTDVHGVEIIVRFDSG